MAVIYYIKNISNNKIYIGQSRNINKRFNRHKNLLKNNKHFNFKLQEDFNTYGFENFKFGIIENVSIDIVDEREEFYIDFFTKLGNCYNIRLNNYTISEETKAKISKNTKIAMAKQEVKCKLSRNVSEETKAKISEGVKKAYANNPNLKIKISEALKGREGRKFTEEEKKLVRGSNNGNSKVCEKDVIDIRNRRKQGEQRKNVYKDYKEKISERNFKAIWLYQNWKHIKID